MIMTVLFVIIIVAVAEEISVKTGTKVKDFYFHM